SKLNENREEIQASLQELTQRYASYPDIGGIGLYSNSMGYNGNFISAFNPILNHLSEGTETTFYYMNSREWFTFRQPAEPFAIYFDDTDHPINSIQRFDSFFQRTVKNNPSLIVFLDMEWFSTTLRAYPQFSHSLAEFNTTGDWLLPLPETEQSSGSANFLVVLLVILWSGLAIQMRYFPYIRPMIIRYFLAHRFFVDDIIHYRERMATGSILMLIAHAIFGGMTAYITAKLLINEVGLQAFFHHFPYLAIAGSNYISLSLAATIIILLTQLIALLWLHLPAKNLSHFSQTLNLYAGSTYLDFVLVTIIVTLYLTNIWPLLTISLSVVFVLIWFASFNISAFDASKAMGAVTFMYLLITIGLHSLVFIGLLIFLFSNDYVVQVISLATAL
ncbi:MAG TPA: hypothetical protein DD671_16505, partial [Balneolaceae bacterium]|nr:hypothetical protein [Balneolaceae bacterium]